MTAVIENQREKVFEIHEDYKQFLDENFYQSTIEFVEGKGFFNQNITLKTGESISIRLDFRGGKMDVFPRIGIVDNPFFIERIKKDFPKFLKLWEHYGKEMNSSLVQFQEVWLRKELNFEDIEEYFGKNDYRYIAQNDAIFLGNVGLLRKKAASYVKELKEGVIPKVIYSLDRVVDAFKKVSEKIPSLVVFNKRDEATLPYYYFGHHGTLKLRAEEQAFYIIDEEIGFNVSLDDLIESENLILPLLETIEKKKRVKNIFEPPTYHIKGKIRTNDEIIKAILDILKKKHTILEIENYFAKYLDGYGKIVEADSYQIFMAMDTYFVIKRYDDTFFKHYETIDDAKKFFTDLVFQKFEDKV